jgi:hypothetical protein
MRLRTSKDEYNARVRPCAIRGNVRGEEKTIRYRQHLFSTLEQLFFLDSVAVFTYYLA